VSARKNATVQLVTADGTTLSTWLSFQFDRRYDEPVESFNFTLAVPPPRRAELFAKLRKGEKVRILINGAPQATCVITTRRRRLGRDGTIVNIEAKGLLVSALTGSVDPRLAKAAQADGPIKDVVLAVLKPYGFATIGTDATADVSAISGKGLNGRKDAVSLDDLTKKDVKADDQPAYNFAASLFYRFGLALRTDNNGELLLGSPDYGQAEAYTVVEDASRAVSGDLMLLDEGIEESDTNEGLYSETIVHSIASSTENGTDGTPAPAAGVAVGPRPSDPPFPSATIKTLEPGRHNYASTLQPYRPRYRLDKKARDRTRCAARAESMHSRGASKAYQIRHAVDGLVSVSGNRIWAVDTVGRVVCDSFEINDPMWLYAVTQSQDRRGGQMTELTWIPLGSLVIGGGS
jgi:prophage tail gpP-like protein